MRSFRRRILVTASRFPWSYCNLQTHHYGSIKVEAITKWPRPYYGDEVRKFTGIAAYYQTFVEGFFSRLAFTSYPADEKGLVSSSKLNTRASGFVLQQNHPLRFLCGSMGLDSPMDFVTVCLIPQKDISDLVVVDRLNQALVSHFFTHSEELLVLPICYELSPKAVIVWALEAILGTLGPFVKGPEITDEELREFTSEYYIPSALHPVVPAASASIADFPVGKVGVYTRFFEFANQRSWDEYLGAWWSLPQLIGKRLIEGPKLIEITNENMAVAKEKLKEARSRQKSYADKHRRDLEFQVGDRVFLKVSPFRGVKRFGIKGKLSPRFIGPFEILERIGEVSYRLALPPQLSHVHDPDMSLSEEPESILDRQERVMRKHKLFPFVKILLEGIHQEREASGRRKKKSMRASYQHFFVRSRGSDFDIPVVFSLVIALLRNKRSIDIRTYSSSISWTQANPILKITIDIFKNTNFFRAFTASSTIPSIYIQQFWDTIRFDKDKGYSCQLDEQRFYLTKATLRDELQLPSDNNNFTPPPNSNTIISFVNNLGYPNVVRTLSGVVTNDMYQPWRALATIINLCLAGKTSGFERPRAPVLQILWGVVNGANIDYAERIWEEFTQCIHSFTKDKMNLALHAEGKKKVNPLVIPGVRFTKLIINHLQSKHKFHKRPGSPLHLPTEESTLGYLKFSFKNIKRVRFGMAIPDTLISEEIRSAAYYSEYVAKVTKYQRYIAGEAVSDDDAPAPKPSKGATTKSTRKPKPQSSKTALKKKRKLVEDTTEAPSQAKRSKAGKVLKKRTLSSTPQLVDEFVDEGVPDKEPIHVFREPDTGKIQPLPEVEGKGKEKVGEEQAAQTPSRHVVYTGPNLDHMDLGIAEASSQPNTKQMDDEFTSTVYLKVQESLKLPAEGDVKLEEPDSSAGTRSSMKNLDKEFSFTDQFLVEKSQEDKPEKTNTEAEVQSMVMIPIHQDNSSVPLMTTPVIDIFDPQSDSITVPASMPTTTTTVTETTTTTIVPPPPPQPQQDVSTLILTQTIGQLEQNNALDYFYAATFFWGCYKRGLLLIEDIFSPRQTIP
ncbi:hypothetical protein Tco_1466808 [Tanacetum coccineum]